MSEQQLLEIINSALWVAVECAGPLLAIGGAVGMLASVLQAATSINEPSLTFVPKLAALGIGTALMGPWLLDRLVHFNTELYNMIATIGANQ